MLKNEWETEETKNVLQLEEKDFNLCDFALFLSVMKNETAHRNVLSIITGEPELELKEVRTTGNTAGCKSGGYIRASFCNRNAK